LETGKEEEKKEEEKLRQMRVFLDLLFLLLVVPND
jgi:hypothetical protein